MISLMGPQLISVFNNKGGVGKTTLTFHLAHALAELGQKVLLIDLDPQCNLTIYCMEEGDIHEVWEKEDDFIEDPGYEKARTSILASEYDELLSSTRSIHFILKPTEEGTGEPEKLPPAKKIANNLFLIPGRLSLHMFEDKIAERWPRTYASDPLSIRTVTKIRQLALDYANSLGADIVLLDTSPSLGSLNKTIIWTADAFIVPCMPDLFSLYGLRNIGNALRQWTSQYETLSKVLSEKSLREFPTSVVTFLGFTLYNARLYTGASPSNIAKAQSKYAEEIPEAIATYIPMSARSSSLEDLIKIPIGGDAVIHSHNTFPSMAQRYKCPMWKVPDQVLDADHKNTVGGNSAKFLETKGKYLHFADEILKRLSLSSGVAE